MFENEKLMVGEHFTYEGIEWICLDIIDGNYLAITAQVWQELPFDLVTQTSDLIADNGDKSYGTCKDYVTILSCNQFRKYRALVPHYPEWMWTLTPWSCFDGNYVRYVIPTGNIDYYNAQDSYGVAPACIFSSKHLKLYRKAHLVEID